MGGVLRLESKFRIDVVANWVLLSNSFRGRICIRLRKQVFTHQSLDVPGVPWHLLVSYFVVRAAHPIFRKSAHVSKNDFVLINLRGELRSVQPRWIRSVALKSLQNNRMDSIVCKNFPLDLSGCGPEPLIFGRDVAGIPGQVFLLVLTRSCKC